MSRVPSAEWVVLRDNQVRCTSWPLHFRRECPKLTLFGFDEREELFQLFGKPSLVRIAMIAAARLVGAIASEERPVLRTVIMKPELVLHYDQIAQSLAVLPAK